MKRYLVILHNEEQYETDCLEEAVKVWKERKYDKIGQYGIIDREKQGYNWIA